MVSFDSVQLLDVQDTRRAAMVRKVQRQPDGSSSTAIRVSARASKPALTRTVRVAAAAFVLGFDGVLRRVLAVTWGAAPQRGMRGEIQKTVNMAVLHHLMVLAANEAMAPAARRAEAAS